MYTKTYRVLFCHNYANYRKTWNGYIVIGKQSVILKGKVGIVMCVTWVFKMHWVRAKFLGDEILLIWYVSNTWGQFSLVW